MREERLHFWEVAFCIQFEAEVGSFSKKQEAAREQIVKDWSHAKKVRFVTIAFPCEDLRGNIARWSTFVVEVFVIGSYAGEAEISYSDFVLGSIINRLDQYVLEFDISMDNLFVLEEIHC